jgi:DNA polymerase-3 subunit alpha
MLEPNFVHLRLRSEYAIEDSILRIKDAVARAVNNRMPALALTDSNLFGMVRFVSQALTEGIKPIIGADVGIAWQNHLFRLLLLVQNEEGYRNLCTLLSAASLNEPGVLTPTVSKEALLAHGSGLIVLSGGAFGPCGLDTDHDTIVSIISALSAAFPDRFYLEIFRAGLPRENIANTIALSLASCHLAYPLESSLAVHAHSADTLVASKSKATGLPLVATHPIQFLEQEDFLAHEARYCIAKSYTLADPRRPKPFSPEQYFPSQEEMQNRFSDCPEALRNTVEIAKRCNFLPVLGRVLLPSFPVPPEKTIDALIEEQTWQALLLQKETLGDRFHLYAERVKRELELIKAMGFTGYFLIVSDFIRWAKANHIPVGPGRGSGAGSLVAYYLGITEVDPIAHGLLFERFLNPERVSMPDFDIDFCQERRDEVIEYVKKRYGSTSVGRIATFGTMAAKAVVRDVGRVLDMPYSFVDTLAKLIPHTLGITLDVAIQEEPQLAQRIESEEEIKNLFDLAKRLEGLPRNVGMHAGGVLIAPGPLTDHVPLYAPEDQVVVSQFDKDDVEAAGLVKFDFLGLKTLTVIDRALYTLKSRHIVPTFEGLADQEVYALLQKGETLAVFQLESRGMRELMQKLLPDTFEDLVALLALFRPGPLGSGMVEDFIARKHGRAKISYFHPELEPILKPTYGIIVYQEQVMQIAQILAGYSLGRADLLRRAMGKKKVEEMATHREQFIQGAKAKGVDLKTATHLFDLMEKFAEYGFNKSHSVAYAMVSYQTGYLKAYFPADFLAASMSFELNDTDKVRDLVLEAKRLGLEVLLPDIQNSHYRFDVLNDKTILYGLGAIKGVGEDAVLEIIRAREEKPFADLYDFCSRVDTRKVNRRSLEALITAGAFDTLSKNRGALLQDVEKALANGELKKRTIGQNSLFESEGMPMLEAMSAPAESWPLEKVLIEEKKSLGFCLSGHLFSAFEKEVRQKFPQKLAEVQAGQVHVAGIVHRLVTKRGLSGKMAFFILDDTSATLEVAVYPEAFAACGNNLAEDALVVVSGVARVDERRDAMRIIANSIALWQDLKRREEEIMLFLDCKQSKTEELAQILHRFPGDSTVFVQYDNQILEAKLRLGKLWRVHLVPGLFQSLTSIGINYKVIQREKHLS